MYKLFLDDIRNPDEVYPDEFNISWVIIRNYKEFVRCISERGLPELISFDHDLHQESIDDYYKIKENPNFVIDYDSYTEKTGYHCAKWLCEFCESNKLNLPKWKVHSKNPVGKQNIIDYLENFKNNKRKK